MHSSFSVLVSLFCLRSIPFSPLFSLVSLHSGRCGPNVGVETIENRLGRGLGTRLGRGLAKSP